ncbi:MarR family transcriptional regulator [Nocardioides sp. W7]|uniref:MarR family winged helix-turn-helix transcriptional regulator n=1 Tax=Nocardioides sp. W7 TaxID=2931390 RepID=UPI001FD41517|nr:MarR family transcriptional regulator [Nocardioides sp. W7]
MTVVEPEGTPISIGVLLLLPYRHLEQRILAAVDAAGYDITLAQARVFQRLDPGGSRLTDLATAAQTTKQAAGFLVDELERGGYVARGPDPRDRRARLIQITDRGRDVVAVALAEQRGIEAEWEAHLGRARLDELRVTLERLREITDPWL